MKSVESIKAALEADPDGWAFAAIKGDSANGLIERRPNYESEVRCLGVLMVLLGRRTEASVDRVAIDAAQFAREHKDAGGIEFHFEK